MKKVAFYTLGCKVNQYETNGMIQKFIEHGYQIVEFHEIADIYVVNTCTVTNISDRKSRQILRRAKEINSNALIVAVGCYVQVAQKEVEKMPEIDLCLGTNEKKEIVLYVEEYLQNAHQKKIDDVFQTQKYDEFGNVTYTEKTRAVIKVQDGCDRFCSYCLIPYARGRVRSRNPESVIKEVKAISQTGIKEVIVTGIHVASYGKDFANDYRLIDLLEEINQIDTIQRIRLGSIEPLLIQDTFLERLQKLHKICPHFHLSLQSGCDETLLRMNRRYTTKQFKEITERLRNIYPDVILTTDLIVGFPGETEEEFEKTYDFLQKIKFYKMHVFKYSARTGTKAALMENQNTNSVKEKRSKRLLALSEENQKKYHEAFVGKTLEVLVEEREGDFFKGHTANYLPVKIKSNQDIIGKIVRVLAKQSTENELIVENDVENVIIL